MTTKESIGNFLSEKKIAIAGVSRDPKKFGYVAYSEMKKRGYELFPLNPETDRIDDQLCFRRPGDLPSEVSALLVVTPKSKSLDVVKQALDKGIRKFWIQQMSETKEVLDLLQEKQADFVSRQCLLMWIDPVTGIHKFHKTIKGWFGLLPK